MEWEFSLEKITAIANEFWQQVPGEKVIAFSGDMGAGKTTFIHALCDVKGVLESVGSPTFSLINEYSYDCAGTKKVLFHLDLYRINDEEEAARAGLEDVLHSGNTCLVEWPEKAPGIFPTNTIYATIQLVNDRIRRLKITNI